MPSKTAAFLVHLLTASGVLCALFAFEAIAAHDLKRAFLWLALALFIDTIDGPLARLVDTKSNLPRFSGERLDLIIDYLNYVVLPAFIIIKGPVLEGPLAYIAAAMILMTSLYHFSDTSSKTRDGYFIGFPAIWNLVIFYLLVFEIYQIPAFALISFLGVMTFVPIKWLHPFRVEYLRKLTFTVVLVGAYAALGATLDRFDTSLANKILLIFTVLYLIAVSLKRNITGR